MQRVRLAELCASTSLFTDLGTGQPVEHGLRTALVAMRLSEVLGLDDAHRCEVYYVSLLRFLGCTADAHVVAQLGGGDDIRILGGAGPTFMGSPREELTQMLRLVGQGTTLPRRMVALARLLSDPRGGERLIQAHCEVASRLSEEMGLPGGVQSALAVAYARWDGKGTPPGLGGDDIPASVRVAIVARDVELWAREADDDMVVHILRDRRGRAYDPSVADAALDLGPERLRRCSEDLWETVLDLEPRPWLELSGPDIDRALVALGDFADLKAPETVGHSRRVTRLVAAAGEARGDVSVDLLSRAGSVHDLGLVAVPVGSIRSDGSSAAAGEQLRLHPAWTQRILGRCEGMAPIGALAGRHHEHLDGTGYPAGTFGEDVRGAGLLACAEMYDELTTPGKGSSVLSPESAARQMTRLAGEGALDAESVKAVLGAAGVVAPLMEVERPAGLTEREVDVLGLLAKGLSNRLIGQELGISPKTVGTHVEHIYAKAGVTTRAAATLFAVQNGLARTGPLDR